MKGMSLSSTDLYFLGYSWIFFCSTNLSEMFHLLMFLRCSKKMFFNNKRSLSCILIMRIQCSNTLTSSKKTWPLRRNTSWCMLLMTVIILNKFLQFHLVSIEIYIITNYSNMSRENSHSKVSSFIKTESDYHHTFVEQAIPMV